MRINNRKQRNKKTKNNIKFSKVNVKQMSILLIIIFSILLISTIFALINSINTKIITKVKINRNKCIKLRNK